MRLRDEKRWPDERRRSEEARTAVLAATVELLLAGGWNRLTMEGIARHAKVSKQTIYRWWPTKGAVVFEAVLGDGPDLLVIPDTGDFRLDLKTLLRSAVAEFSEPSFDRLMRAVAIGFQEDPALARQLQRRVLNLLTAVTVDWLDAARSKGQIDPDVDPAVLVELIYGPLLRRWLLGTGELDREFADAVAVMVCQAASSRGRGR